MKCKVFFCFSFSNVRALKCYYLLVIMIVSNIPIMKPFPEGKGEIYDFVVVNETYGDGLFSAIGIPVLPESHLKESLMRRLYGDFTLKNVGRIVIYEFPSDIKSVEMKKLIEEVESATLYNNIDVFVINPPQQHWIIDPVKGKVPVGPYDPDDERKRLEKVVLELGYEKKTYPNPFDMGTRYVKDLE